MKDHNNKLFVAVFFWAALIPAMAWGMEINYNEKSIIDIIGISLKNHIPDSHVSNPLSPIDDSSKFPKTRCQPPTKPSSQSASSASIDAKPVTEEEESGKAARNRKENPEIEYKYQRFGLLVLMVSFLCNFKTLQG